MQQFAGKIKVIVGQKRQEEFIIQYTECFFYLLPL